MMRSRAPAFRPTRYWSYILSLLAGLVIISAMGGLTLVWLRQQITDTATRIQVTQRERIEVERRLEYLSSRIAEMHRPDVLRAQAASMGLTLTRPDARQIVRMGPLSTPPREWLDGVVPLAPATSVHDLSPDLAAIESIRRYGN